MASSVAALSRRVCRSLLSNPKTPRLSMSFCTDLSSHEKSDSDMDGTATFSLDSDSVPDSSSPSVDDQESTRQPFITDRPLENGLDVGIYKAILVGEVGQTPIQKRLKSGQMVTLLSIGTGGIRNNRRPLENEDPREYANRSAVQWHRVSVYPERLGDTVLKHAIPGSIVYLEGNLETKMFTDPITGLVKRIREVAIRRNGRLVFLGPGHDDAYQTNPTEHKRAGYF